MTTIGTRRRDGQTLYTIGGTRGDGTKYTWFALENIAEVLVTALNMADDARRKSEIAEAEARAYTGAVVEARSLVPASERIEAYRSSLSKRLDWAAHFLVAPHSRTDTWPVEKSDQLPVVRGIIAACDHEPSLERWLMICERFLPDWADRLMRATGVTP